MNNTEKLAQEKFGGNIEEALKYIIINIRGEELNKFMDEWTPEQSAFALDSLYVEASNRIGEDNVKACFKQAVNEEEFNLTYEEIKNSKKNPFKSQMLKDFLKLILVNAALIGVSVVVDSLELSEFIKVAAMTLDAILTTNFSLNLGVDIVKYVKYRKTKKELQKQEENLNEGKVL